MTPFVVNSSTQFQRANRIHRGIPDPWEEYLAANGLSSESNRKIIKRSLDLGYDNIRLTDFVWNKLGLPLTQGIPDPWKTVPIENNSCFGDEKTDICLVKKKINFFL